MNGPGGHHGSNGTPDSQRQGPRLRPEPMETCKTDDRTDDMATQDVHRLRERRLRIAEHQDTGGTKGTQQQRHIESVAQQRKRTNGQKTTEASQKDRKSTQMCRALCAGAPATLNEIDHWGICELHGLKSKGSATLELGGLFRALRRIAGAIGMRADPCEFAALHDQILIAHGTVLEVALEDFPDSCGVARLR